MYNTKKKHSLFITGKHSNNIYTIYKCAGKIILCKRKNRKKDILYMTKTTATKT